jgi:ParB-like chromosome segregation protein Spo0J
MNNHITIEMWPIDKPIPYARNPRKISDAAIAKVAGSLKEFGFRQPVVVDGDGVIVVGHTRLEAARRLGMTQVPVHVAGDLSPTKAKAYRMTDNRVSEESDWDNGLLRLELEDLRQLDFDLPVIGFDASELDDLFRDNFDDPDDGELGDGGSSEIDADQPQAQCECPKCGFTFVPDSTDAN